VILDTSAIMAIIQDEPDRRALQSCLVAAETLAISAATLVELGIVIEGRAGEAGWR